VEKVLRDANGNRPMTPQQIATIVQNGLALHQRGDIVQAEAHYRQALQSDPNHADALHLLGVIAHHAGNVKDAIPLLRRAAQRRPSDPNIQHNLGIVLKESGEARKAIEHYRKAIAANPGFAEAHNNLGVALRELGLHDEALSHFNKAVALNPQFCEALANVGAEFSDRRRYEEARTILERALQIRPDYISALSNLGAVLNMLSRPEEGAGLLQRAIALQPEFVEAHLNYGVVLRALDRYEEAEREYRFVLERLPGSANAHANLGVLLRGRGQIDQAKAAFEHARKLDPKSGEAYLGLAGLENSFGDPVLALSLFDQGVKRRPGDAEALYVRALGYLTVGRLREGWADYDLRSEVTEIGMLKARRPFTQPLWDGKPLQGKTLLVWGEQGIGDEIWSAGMLLDLMQRVGPGNRVIVEGPKKLEGLFKGSFTGKVGGVEFKFVARKDPPDPSCVEEVDYQIATGSLGKHFRQELSGFPKREETGGAYLVADAGREAYWRDRLAQGGAGLKIGVGWRSTNLRGERALSCTRLSQWGEIFKVPGVRFINLQYDQCEAELKEAEALHGVKIERYPVDMFDDLDETAALMRNLDLVISAPTSVSILSAALGVTTWQMNHGVEWQLHGQPNHPWYPSMTPYARRWDQPWEEIIKRMANDLQALTARQTTEIAA
jgi:tetratricopeptide (TPR) repeat protein